MLRVCMKVKHDCWLHDAQITLRCLIYWDLLIRINKNSCAFQKRKQVYRTRTLIVFIKLCSSIIHWSISITDLDCSWSLFLDIRLMEMTRICGVWSWELSMARGLDLDPPTTFRSQKMNDGCDYFTQTHLMHTWPPLGQLERMILRAKMMFSP